MATGNFRSATFFRNEPVDASRQNLHEIQSNGRPMPQRRALNFVGHELIDDFFNDRINIIDQTERIDNDNRIQDERIRLLEEREVVGGHNIQQDGATLPESDNLNFVDVFELIKNETNESIDINVLFERLISSQNNNALRLGADGRLFVAIGSGGGDEGDDELPRLYEFEDDVDVDDYILLPIVTAHEAVNVLTVSAIANTSVRVEIFENKEYLNPVYVSHNQRSVTDILQLPVIDRDAQETLYVKITATRPASVNVSIKYTGFRHELRRR